MSYEDILVIVALLFGLFLVIKVTAFIFRSIVLLAVIVGAYYYFYM